MQLTTSPLPPLDHDEERMFHPPRGWVEGPVVALEAKALQMSQRPKSSLGVSRSTPSFHQPHTRRAPRQSDEVARHLRGKPPYQSRRPSSSAPTSNTSSSPSFHFDRTPDQDVWDFISGVCGAGTSLSGGEKSTLGTTFPPRLAFSPEDDEEDDKEQVESAATNQMKRPQTVHEQRRASTPTIMDADDPKILRGEIHRLQTTLLNKFRGRNRFVGGSQFKATTRKKSVPCGECMQVRESLRRSRSECRILRISIHQSEALVKQLTLNKNLNTRKSSSKGNSSDATTQDTKAQDTITHLTIRATEASKAEAEMRLSRDSLAARVSDLEMEARNFTLRRSKSDGDTEEKEESLTEALLELEELRKSHAERCAFEEEVAEPRESQCKSCVTLELQLEGEKEATKKLELELQSKQHIELELLREKISNLEEECSCIKRERDKNSQLLQEAAESMSKSENLQHKIIAVSKELEDVKQKLATSKVAALKQKAQLGNLSDQHDTLQKELELIQQRWRETETALEETKKRWQKERGQWETEALNHAAEIQTARGVSHNLKTALRVKEDACKQLKHREERLNEVHRDSLRAVLNNSVRLCVVAPTVNINLNDRISSFCSALPENQIRVFVENSVLPRFTRVLLQPGMEDGDKGQVGFDKWLKELLMDMQTCIEKHIAKVFETQASEGDRNAVVALAQSNHLL